ncbi:probable serine/threonine-protein kinase kinX [Solea solea]|uniref:probable serine/threonine-protein kinase kinX n=1 Tax=Solea solea TaxID=90069 RepID=UPI002729C35B|nr:probable serine/threonine-protein kinase kinX [Solea solea]
MERLEKLTDEAIQEIQNKYSRLRHRQDGLDGRMIMTQDKQQDCISEQQRVQLEGSLVMNRSEVELLEEAIATKCRQLDILERHVETESYGYEVFVKMFEERANDARPFLEKERLSRQREDAVIERLSKAVRILQRGVANAEEMNKSCGRYRNLLLRLLPPEWQDTLKAETQVSSDSNDEDEGPSGREDQDEQPSDIVDQEEQQSDTDSQDEELSDIIDQSEQSSTRDSQDEEPSDVIDQSEQPSVREDQDEQASVREDQDDQPSVREDQDEQASVRQDQDEQPSVREDQDEQASVREDQDEQASVREDQEEQPSDIIDQSEQLSDIADQREMPSETGDQDYQACDNDDQSEKPSGMDDSGEQVALTEGPTLASPHSDTLLKDSELDGDGTEYEKKYLFDSQQLLELMKEVNEQNLSLIEMRRLYEEEEELHQDPGIPDLNTMNKVEKKLVVQEFRDRVESFKITSEGDDPKEAMTLQELDAVLDPLALKVTDVHYFCTRRQVGTLSTLDKLLVIKDRVSLLLQNIEKRRRQNLQHNKEKGHMKRSLSGPPQKMERKPMPRYNSVGPKVEPEKEDNSSGKEEVHD